MDKKLHGRKEGVKCASAVQVGESGAGIYARSSVIGSISQNLLATMAASHGAGMYFGTRHDTLNTDKESKRQIHVCSRKHYSLPFDTLTKCFTASVVANGMVEHEQHASKQQERATTCRRCAA